MVPWRWRMNLGWIWYSNMKTQAAKHYGSKYLRHPAVTVLDKMTKDLSRSGRSVRAGFYEYDNLGEQSLWEGLGEHFPNSRKEYSRTEIMERFLFAQVIEAVWCLQEGIIQSEPEANLGSIHGWGFPSFKGGVLQYINSYGVPEFMERCKYYEKQHGPRFKAPKWLRQKAEEWTQKS